MSSRTPFDVEQQLSVHRVADLALEGPECFPWSCPRRPAFEVGPAFSARWRTWQMAAMWMAWLRCRFPRRTAVHDTAAGGPFDRGGAVVGSEGIPVGKPADVAGVADELAAMIGPTP